MPQDNQNEGFCTRCGTVIESFEGLSACPSCGTDSIPCSNADQINISINTHELRILTIWAERWVMAMENEYDQANSATTLRAITGRISKQLEKPVSLLLSDEIQQIKGDGFDVSTNITEI